MIEIPDPEELQQLINTILKEADEDTQKINKEIKLKLDSINSISVEKNAFDNTKISEILSKSDPLTYDFIKDQVKFIKLQRLMNEAQSLYIQYLLRSYERNEFLTELTRTSIDAEHKLDVKIVVWEELQNKDKLTRSQKARFAANKRHEKTNEAKVKIKEIWATGKYTAKDICAEQECSALGISFSTARKALLNLPTPT